MAGVLGEAEEEVHSLMLETADYWLSLGLAIGIERPDDAATLLGLIEAHECNRAELAEDVAALCQEVRRYGCWLEEIEVQLAEARRSFTSSASGSGFPTTR